MFKANFMIVLVQLATKLKQRKVLTWVSFSIISMAHIFTDKVHSFVNWYDLDSTTH
jgi:hypothetical protein